MLWMLVFLAEEKFAAAALGCAFSLAVGNRNALPYALVAILVVSVGWARGREGGAHTRRFGVALAVVAALLAGRAPSPRDTVLAGACDTYSLFYAAPLAGGRRRTWRCIAGLPPAPGAGSRSRASRFFVVALAPCTIQSTLPCRALCRDGPAPGHDLSLPHQRGAPPPGPLSRFAPSEFREQLSLRICGIARVARGGARRRAIASSACCSRARALRVATVKMRKVPFAIVFALPGLAVFLAQPQCASLWLRLSAAAILLASGAIFAPRGSPRQARARAPHRRVRGAGRLRQPRGHRAARGAAGGPRRGLRRSGTSDPRRYRGRGCRTLSPRRRRDSRHLCDLHRRARCGARRPHAPRHRLCDGMLRRAGLEFHTFADP